MCTYWLVKKASEVDKRLGWVSCGGAEAEASGGDDDLWSGVIVDKSSIETKLNDGGGRTPVDEGFDTNILGYAGGGIAAVCLIAAAAWFLRREAKSVQRKKRNSNPRAVVEGDFELNPVAVVGRATLTLTEESQNNTAKGESVQGLAAAILSFKLTYSRCLQSTSMRRKPLLLPSFPQLRLLQGLRPRPLEQPVVLLVHHRRPSRSVRGQNTTTKSIRPTFTHIGMAEMRSGRNLPIIGKTSPTKLGRERGEGEEGPVLRSQVGFSDYPQNDVVLTALLPLLSARWVG